MGVRARSQRLALPPLAILALLASVSMTACGPESTRAALPPTPTPASGTLPTHAGDDWTTFLGDSMRSGIGPSAPTGGQAHRTWTAQVDGEVYAGPLVAGSAVIAATERNWVYSLNATDGATRWRTHLGEPVPLAQLACGNIDLNGITSTPVIDVAAGIVYVVAMLKAPLRHELFAIRLADGSVAWHRLADAPGADPRIHQQRGALNLAQGRVYIAYGGFTGDCGAYHGRVVAVASDGSGPLLTWQVPSGQEGGIWAPAGPVISAGGDVWVSTGNTEVFNPNDDYDGANAVYRLDPALSADAEQWAPSNWANLNRGDIDLGSLSPALLPDGLVFIAGKEGIGYLLRVGHLGGIGGQAFRAPVCTGGPTAGAFGAAAVAGLVYVPCKDGIAALRVDATKPAFSVVWHAAPGSNSPVLAYGLLWTVAADANLYRGVWNGGLVGVDPVTGVERVRIPLGTLPHFPAPAAARGSLYIGGLGAVYAVKVS